VPASASLSITAVADRVGGLALPDLVALTPGVQYVLGGVVDPCKRRGIRHGLVAVLTAPVCAVSAGARSFVIHTTPDRHQLRRACQRAGRPCSSGTMMISFSA
jgi:hypothetical protein